MVSLDVDHVITADVRRVGLVVGGWCRSRGRLECSERAAGERDAVGMMHEPIENRVAKRGVADQIVPVIDRDLAGHQGAATNRSP